MRIREKTCTCIGRLSITAADSFTRAILTNFVRDGGHEKSQDLRMIVASAAVILGRVCKLPYKPRRCAANQGFVGKDLILQCWSA